LPLPESQKNGDDPGLFALSRTQSRYFFSVSLVEFLHAISDEAEIVPLQSLHVFERPVEALEDREAVD
jgi:hypothetical protein